MSISCLQKEMGCGEGEGKSGREERAALWCDECSSECAKAAAAPSAIFRLERKRARGRGTLEPMKLRLLVFYEKLL